MTAGLDAGLIEKRSTSVALWLTGGMWLFCAFAFIASLSIARGRLISAPTCLWVVAITVAGLLVSFGLFGLVRAMSGRRAEVRWAVLAVSVLVATAGQALIDGLLNEAFARAFDRPEGVWFNRQDFAVNCLIYIGLYGFYVAALEVISTTARAAEHARRSAVFAVQVAEAREQAREAQLQMLRFQLNPHFLFNTLNSISSLVVGGQPEAAESMINRLCRFMRASLKPADDDLMPLGHELATMEAYIEIESTRFSDALDIEIECPPDLEDALVPGLILQPLVENAIKYALTPSEGRSRMRIVIHALDERLEVSVVDEGSGRAPDPEAGVGIGLENIRRRLAVIYGETAQLDAGAAGTGFHARICLPLQRVGLKAAA
ncbi:MAG: hypothetical protein EON87_01885 [Brevundimonas sp.]|nr:MAG: hypothetical protein EON87_01885 [Brevundimonas sp.]